MADRKRIALLVAQADENYQSQFIEGFIDNAFKHNADVLVFGSYLKYQNNLGREAGETSIFSLIPFEEFDAVAVMADTLQSPGLADSVEEKGKYDIVVANILADVIIPLSSIVRRFMKPDGVFISSGIIYSKEEEVKNALVENGFEIVEIQHMGEWVSFVAK